MERNQELTDSFNGVILNWKLVSKQIPSKYYVCGTHTSIPKSELCFFKLSFNEKHKDIVLNSYLPYIIKKSKEGEGRDTDIEASMLYTLKYECMVGGKLDKPNLFNKYII